jgi:hypothetical protein
MLGLVRVDTIFRLKPTLLDGSKIFSSNISKIFPLLLTPLKLGKLGANVLRPIIFILLRLCSFVLLLRPDRIVLNKLGQPSRWTLFCYSPQNFIALLKLLALALTAALMYNPGVIAKTIAFIYAVSVVIARLIMRAALLTFKLVALLARSVLRVCLRSFRSRHSSCYKLNDII